jgi:hypothetical protein
MTDQVDAPALLARTDLAQLLAEPVHQQQVRTQRVVGEIDGLIVMGCDIAKMKQPAHALRVVMDTHRNCGM